MVCYIYWLFTLSISMLLGFCLSFCQFQLDVANKSFAYKKTCSPETVHSNNLMKKKYGTLQLPFICLFLLLTTFSGLQNCKSVFLILKIFHYGGSKRWFSFFQDIHIRMNIRLIDILTSIRPMTTTVWKVSVIGVFLVCIFQRSDWIQRNTPYLSVFSPNVGKYGPEKLQIQRLFTQSTKSGKQLRIDLLETNRSSNGLKITWLWKYVLTIYQQGLWSPKMDRRMVKRHQLCPE